MTIHKKYNKFINEAYYKRKEESKKLDDAKLSFLLHKKDRNKLSDLRDDFVEDVLSTKEFYSTYFSDLCKKEDLTQSDMDIDYYQMQKLLDRKGWNWNSINNLFSKEVNDICGEDIFEVVHKSPLDSTNGYIDYYLYRTVDRLGLDKNKIELGGASWAESYNVVSEELKVRYKYGYHHTAYGQLMLDQAGITAKDFVNEVKALLLELLEEDWSDEIIMNIIRQKPCDRELLEVLRNNHGWNQGPNDINRYLIKESDRFIINIKDVIDELNRLFKSMEEEGDYYSCDYEDITFEDFTSQISKLLYDFTDDLTITNEELIIWVDLDPTKHSNII